MSSERPSAPRSDPPSDRGPGVAPWSAAGTPQRADASGNTPVVLIHGLWLLPSSWANWAAFIEQAGYAPLTPDWPDDPETVEEARANPDVFAKKTLQQIADHTTEIIDALGRNQR